MAISLSLFFLYGDHIQRATQLSRTFEYTTLRTNLWSQTVSFRLNEIVNDCLLWYLILWCCYRTNLQTGFTTARGKCFSQLENQNSVTANVYTTPHIYIAYHTQAYCSPPWTTIRHVDVLCRRVSGPAISTQKRWIMWERERKVHTQRLTRNCKHIRYIQFFYPVCCCRCCCPICLLAMLLLLLLLLLLDTDDDDANAIANAVAVASTVACLPVSRYNWNITFSHFPTSSSPLIELKHGAFSKCHSFQISSMV